MTYGRRASEGVKGITHLLRLESGAGLLLRNGGSDGERNDLLYPRSIYYAKEFDNSHL